MKQALILISATEEEQQRPQPVPSWQPAKDRGKSRLFHVGESRESRVASATTLKPSLPALLGAANPGSDRSQPLTLRRRPR